MLQSSNFATWHAKMLLRVDILSRCLAGIDKTFDETKWHYRVSSVMRPSDPEARKRYDQLAAEDERGRQRSVRNSALRSWGEHCRRELEGQLAGVVAHGEFDALATITNAIARKISDAQVRDKLLKGVEDEARIWVRWRWEHEDAGRGLPPRPGGPPR
jgi:hypothetical protein